MVALLDSVAVAAFLDRDDVFHAAADARIRDEVHPVDRAVAERAAELRAARASLRLPDALILATADLRNADVVITGDRHWTNVDGGARVELLGSSGA